MRIAEGPVQGEANAELFADASEDAGIAAGLEELLEVMSVRSQGSGSTEAADLTEVCDAQFADADYDAQVVGLNAQEA